MKEGNNEVRNQRKREMEIVEEINQEKLQKNSCNMRDAYIRPVFQYGKGPTLVPGKGYGMAISMGKEGQRNE